jgi:hypothetical protein
VFIAYALGLGLVPIWVLHAILLPLNVWRLAQALGLNDRSALMQAVRGVPLGKGRGKQLRSLPSPQAAL